jgi:hypothetical protein
MIFLYLIRSRMTLRIWAHLVVIYQENKKKNTKIRKRSILSKWLLALTFLTKSSKSLLIKKNQNCQSKSNKRRLKRVKQRINNFSIEKFKKDYCSMLSNVVLKMAFKIKKTKIIKKITKLIKFNLNKLRNKSSKSNHKGCRSQIFHLVMVLIQILILKMKIWFCFQHIQRVSSTKMVKMSFLKTK